MPIKIIKVFAAVSLISLCFGCSLIGPKFDKTDGMGFSQNSVGSSKSVKRLLDKAGDDSWMIRNAIDAHLECVGSVIAEHKNDRTEKPVVLHLRGVGDSGKCEVLENHRASIARAISIIRKRSGLKIDYQVCDTYDRLQNLDLVNSVNSDVLNVEVTFLPLQDADGGRVSLSDYFGGATESISLSKPGTSSQSQEKKILQTEVSILGQARLGLTTVRTEYSFKETYEHKQLMGSVGFTNGSSFDFSFGKSVQYATAEDELARIAISFNVAKVLLTLFAEEGVEDFCTASIWENDFVSENSCVLDGWQRIIVFGNRQAVWNQDLLGRYVSFKLIIYNSDGEAKDIGTSPQYLVSDLAEGCYAVIKYCSPGMDAMQHGNRIEIRLQNEDCKDVPDLFWQLTTCAARVNLRNARTWTEAVELVRKKQVTRARTREEL